MDSGTTVRNLFPFCIVMAWLLTPGTLAARNKVDVCHIPPGNPENARTINISENAVQAHLDHGDALSTCEPVRTTGDGAPESESACACPRAGVWRVTNLDGWMECNVMGIKRKLRGEDPNDGAIWILNDDCSTFFAEAYEKDAEDIELQRGRDCLYFAVSPGEEGGAEVIFDGAYKIESEEFITGEYFMEMSSMGADCSGYRPFEINFLKPIKEKDYAKAEKKMQKQLDAARQKVVDHLEQIDRYLEKTEGGKALGGCTVTINRTYLVHTLCGGTLACPDTWPVKFPDRP